MSTASPAAVADVAGVDAELPAELVPAELVSSVVAAVVADPAAVVVPGAEVPEVDVVAGEVLAGSVDAEESESSLPQAVTASRSPSVMVTLRSVLIALCPTRTYRRMTVVTTVTTTACVLPTTECDASALARCLRLTDPAGPLTDATNSRNASDAFVGSPT
jgi:hypothetical protein